MRTPELQTIKKRYNIVGNCDALNHVLDVALQVAPTDLSVLIAGESGVGKEIIPRIIHDNSPRKRQNYFAINCGSIPEGTIDSELFGHIKGSFTGAISDSPGYFGVADKGTLFLDEVGELPLATQARLLRVLETGEYIPVGATEVRKTDVRIVAATNLNMRKALSEGRFREDLYYRLNSIPIQMPPLRDRGEDIALLFRLFALETAEKYHMEKIVLTDDAKQMLLRYKWPGNVRQLKNITEQISILSPERLITAEQLQQFIPQDRESTQLTTISRPNDRHSFETERELIYKIMYELREKVSDLTRQVNALREQAAGSNQTAVMISREITDNTTAEEHVTEDAVAEEYTSEEYITADNAATADENTTTGDTADYDTGAETNFSLDKLEKDTIIKALEHYKGNRRKAAEALNISERGLYRRIKDYGIKTMLALLVALFTACSVSYKFNGASIDYTKTKTITIADFPNRASYVWAPMASMFNNELKDEFANHTKLTQVKRNGDLKIEGEITKYTQQNKSVSSEGYSAQTELSMTVNVRFTNNANHTEDFERSFTATSTYDTTQSLNSVQEDLVTEMIEEIVDQIFNATVANW